MLFGPKFGLRLLQKSVLRTVRPRIFESNKRSHCRVWLVCCLARIPKNGLWLHQYQAISGGHRYCELLRLYLVCRLLLEKKKTFFILRTCSRSPDLFAVLHVMAARLHAPGTCRAAANEFGRSPPIVSLLPVRN